MQFAGLFDVMRDTKVAEDAINSVIETRQDLAMALQFPGKLGSYGWAHLPLPSANTTSSPLQRHTGLIYPQSQFS